MLARTIDLYFNGNTRAMDEDDDIHVPVYICLPSIVLFSQLNHLK